jgi:hypothetical protein
MRYLEHSTKGILMKITEAAVALCCTLLLAACFPPMTTHPVGGASAGPELRLLGDWNAKMAQADPGKQDANFFFRMKGGRMHVLITQPGAMNHEDDMAAIVTAATVRGNVFLNAQLIAANKHQDMDSQPPGTIALLCKFDDARHVTLYLMDEDATKAAIRAGKIEGHVEPGQFGDATITARPGVLNAFVSSREGLALFSEKVATLTR